MTRDLDSSRRPSQTKSTVRAIAPILGLFLLHGPVRGQSDGPKPAVPEAAATAPTGYEYWTPGSEQSQRLLETSLNAIPQTARLAGFHSWLAKEPHVAGTAADAQVAKRLARIMSEMGLEVETQDIWPLLAFPIGATLEIVWPEHVPLRLKERALSDDPFSSHAGISIGWNAYSASKEATGDVVYANYGTKEDFEFLARSGIDVTGRIVIARYGRNFRGYKARFAEAAGAAGLLIYTDPADAGYVLGPAYPQGGYANETSIQRGSILTLGYPGDPLTPFAPATRDAKRQAPEEVAFPKIPVQPIGWQAAEKILSRLAGREAPKRWQGGLPLTYRLGATGDLRVRLNVRQERRTAKTTNVLGFLRGTEHPEQLVVVGCHHDAWTFGAGDPLAGTMVVLECARSFAALARKGIRPKRTIVFAHWAAEEFGLIGSTEWVEANREMLSKHGVAYLNLDMAAMGMDFGSSSSPSLKRLIAEAARAVPLPAKDDSESRRLTVFDAWAGGNASSLPDGLPQFGSLGGGSDHVAFYCHAGIPSAGLSAGGASGNAYHSAYDTLTWYRRVVGKDYQSALVLTRVLNILVARLADADVLPLDPAAYGSDTVEHLTQIRKRAEERNLPLDATPLADAARRYAESAERIHRRLLNRLRSGRLGPEQLQSVNRSLLTLERIWISDRGLPGRPWFRNLFAATDESSGYAAWMLPLLRHAVENRDRRAAERATQVYRDVFDRLDKNLRELDRVLE